MLALALSEIGDRMLSPALISASSLVSVAFLPVPMPKRRFVAFQLSTNC